MMCRRRLFFITIACLYLTTASAIQCYLGLDHQCMLGFDVTDCGSDDTCQCVKYRFQCTNNDQGCSPEEQANEVKKWAYIVIGANTCKLMESFPSYFEEVSCCSTDECNKPASDTCSRWSYRRRSLRKLANLLHHKA